MSVKDDILLAFLHAGPDVWLSGEQLAASAHVSRAAVWKAIEALREDGVDIEAMHGKGYRLSAQSDPLSVLYLNELLGHKYYPDAQVAVMPSVDSTNNVALTWAKDGAAEGSVAVAGQQTAGRGRRGRPFISPGDIGVYLSIVLRPTMAVDKALSVTAMAGLAVCHALEDACGCTACIKWVNDIYVQEKKVCGILTEASSNLETGLLDYAVVGIGVNVYEPKGGYPAEIVTRAGCVSESIIPGLRTRIAAGIITELMKLYTVSAPESIVQEYRERSMLTNRAIEITGGEHDGQQAIAQSIDDNFNLIVTLPDGSTTTLHTGEVSTKPL